MGNIYTTLFLKSKQAKAYFAPGGIMVSLMPKGCKSFTALRNMLPFDEKERKRFPLFSYVRFKLWLLKHIFITSYKMSDGIIFISKYSRSEVMKLMPNINGKSKVIYHGINNDFLKKMKSTQLPKSLVSGQYYLYVSILDVYKAQKEVIEEWLQLNRNGNEFPLILVGQNYNEYGEQVVQLISKSGADNIHYLGPINYEDLPTVYQNARALIFASSCECCPNILLEKLASSRPVICSNIMPMPEFGKEATIYFDPYRKGALESAVNYLESNDNLLKYSISSSNRAKDFNWTKTAKRTLDYLLTE